jgi:hypothetical protein
MPKQVLNERVSTHVLIEQVPDKVSSEEETSITIPDVYETYIDSLAPGERPIPCKGTSIRFLTSPLLSYYPPVHMYSPPHLCTISRDYTLSQQLPYPTV